MNETKLLFADLFTGAEVLKDSAKKISKATGLIPFFHEDDVDKIDQTLNVIMGELVLMEQTIRNMRGTIGGYEGETVYGDIRGGTPLEKLAQ